MPCEPAQRGSRGGPSAEAASHLFSLSTAMPNPPTWRSGPAVSVLLIACANLANPNLARARLGDQETARQPVDPVCAITEAPRADVRRALFTVHLQRWRSAGRSGRTACAVPGRAFP